MRQLLKPSLNWLLVFVPFTIGAEHYAPDSHAMVFLCACVSIIPLAAWMGKATEHLAERVGEGAGGLLNATFGNAAELIIAVVAMKNGLYTVVKASLTGSIIGNILLVMGASVFCGGLRFKTQRFNATAANAQSTMLTLAAISLVLPAAYHYLAGPGMEPSEKDLSVEIAIVLLATYVAGLIFTLVSHKQLFAGPSGKSAHEAHGDQVPWSIVKAMAVLTVATLFVAWISEILVGSVEQAAAAFGMTSVFVGVIVVAIVGNAAEHSTAILVALKDRMDLSLSIAIGSSIQVALFVAPLLVLLSYWIGPRRMDLVFTPAEVLAVVVAVLITGQIAADGESNWLEGLQLLATYVILGIIFYFLPA